MQIIMKETIDSLNQTIDKILNKIELSYDEPWTEEVHDRRVDMEIKIQYIKDTIAVLEK